jgi:hypothetical protein
MASIILQQLQWRYACKKFDSSKIVSEEKLNIIKESFNLTATSYGLQPLKLIVINSTDIKAKLVPITMEQKQVQEASHVLVFCIETQMTAKYIENYFDRVEQIRNTPRAILQPFETYLVDDFSEKSSETIQVWMEKQAYLAMGNILTVCAMEGIDACPIEGFEPDKYDSLLGLNSLGLKSVLVLPIGYRSDDDMFADFKKVRRGINEVIINI